MQLILAAVAPCFILICASRSTCCTCTFSSSPAPLAPFHLATSWHPPASCATTIVRPSSALEGFPFGCGIVVVTLPATLFCALPCPLSWGHLPPAFTHFALPLVLGRPLHLLVCVLQIFAYEARLGHFSLSYSFIFVSVSALPSFYYYYFAFAFGARVLQSANARFLSTTLKGRQQIAK